MRSPTVGAAVADDYRIPNRANRDERALAHAASTPQWRMTRHPERLPLS
ncbi:hypothetical protein [Nocardia gipuzkoensis]|nr:hypothetical protein [Nocardia gipuzkoensis]